MILNVPDRERKQIGIEFSYFKFFIKNVAIQIKQNFFIDRKNFTQIFGKDGITKNKFQQNKLF